MEKTMEKRAKAAKRTSADRKSARAVRKLVCYTPENKAVQRDGDADKRILANMRRQAPWLREVISECRKEIDRG